MDPGLFLMPKTFSLTMYDAIKSISQCLMKCVTFYFLSPSTPYLQCTSILSPHYYLSSINFPSLKPIAKTSHLVICVPLLSIATL